ncbi:MAG: SUMF1/EgtB/PvdO family nonheme iron enzyme [Spirochaetales bacterium]|nr:SUMF1/EgtB/PvdO family nonheme iron enzyme [Spirochaetales bacterium]
MKFVSKLSYIIAVVAILTALVGCPVSEPDDTVKITELQTAIDKAASGDTITLSNYGDITNYNAKIDKPLTIDGANGLFDLNNATLTINVNGVTIKKISNANVIIGADVGNGSCTIIGSSLVNLTVSGCGMLSGSLILDNTTVETAVFNKTVNDNAEYVGLDIRNVSEIKRMSVDTSVALKSDTVYDARNAVSLNITPDKNQYAALAVLPEYRNDIAEGNNIVSVRFYDPLLEDNEVKAQIDVLLKSGDVDSTVQRDFLIQSCKYLLGNVMEHNIQSSIFGGKIEADVSVDIQNMVDTVRITFHNNLPNDPTTDVIKVITNKEYAMPVIGFIHTEPETHTLHGWSTTAGSNTTDYAIGKAVKFSENTDLYAVWMTMYTISYRDKDGTGDVEFNAWDTEYSPQIYYFTDEIVTLPSANAVSKEGYIFCGWYEDKEYTSSAISGWSANTKTGNQTFYAKWEYCVSLSDILFRSGDTTMTVKWTNPNNASLSKIKINCNNGTVTEVTANAGERGSYTFNSLTNGTQYTCSLSAVDNKGNENKSQTINNYCGSYIGTDGSLYIKGIKYEKTAMKAVTDINTDVTVEGSEGAFISDRTVTLSPYRIGQYEVTQKLYQAITGSNPSSHIGDNYPVENVSRYDCLRMCRKLNELFGYENASAKDETVDITKEGFRLPTEAEWEFAARGGDPSAAAWDYTYSGSDTIGEVAWYADNSGKTTHEVGTKTHNSLGIYDMSGNVWEWAADTYIDDIPTGTVVNPLITSGNSFVQLGGGYAKTASFCKVTARTGDYNASKSKVCGFRLAINGKE